MIYILSTIGSVLFNMFLFKRNAYYMKHKGEFDTVFYIKDPLLRLLILLLCLVPLLGPILMVVHTITTIMSYMEVVDELPNKGETRLGKFLSKYI